MKLKINSRRPGPITLCVIVTIASIGSLSLVTPAALAAEPAVTREKNPPGDIPDSQVFITYKSPLGFSIKVPEGWSRTERADGVAFADKYGSIDISIAAIADVPIPATVRANEVAELQKSGHAVTIGGIEPVRLPAGPSVLVKFQSNSQPNAVTNKKIRLEHDRYLVAHNGKRATMDFAAPAGADNADQWRLMSHSFVWN